MDRALKIPEIVSMIVESIAGDPTIGGPSRKVLRTTPVLSDLAKLARVARLWWKPAIRGIYHDMNTYRLTMLLAIIDPGWTYDKVPTTPPSRQRWCRFLEYASGVKLMAIGIRSYGDAPEEQRTHTYTRAFQALAALHRLNTPNEPIFPNMGTLRISVRDSEALRWAVILLQPRLLWFKLVSVAVPINGIPRFLDELHRLAPHVRRICIDPHPSQSDSDAVAVSLSRFSELSECKLFYEITCLERLQALSQVEHLVSVQLDLDPGDVKITGPLPFSRLQSLTVKGNSQALINVFVNVDLPALSDLNIHIRPDNFGSWATIRSTLRDSIKSLHQLSLHIERIAPLDQQLPEAHAVATVDFVPLGDFPELRQLEIVDARLRGLSDARWKFGVDDEVLVCIAESWPKLEALTVMHGVAASDPCGQSAMVSFQGIMDLVMKRCPLLEFVRLLIRSESVPNLPDYPQRSTDAVVKLACDPPNPKEDISVQRDGAYVALIITEQLREGFRPSQCFPFLLLCRRDLGDYVWTKLETTELNPWS